MSAGRRGFRVLAAVVVTTTLTTGCALERSGVSASSLNPNPWFNFQLAPKKKDTSNYQRSIARSTTDRVTVQPAVSPVQKEVRWRELTLPSLRRESQLIPRTDDVAKSKPQPQRVVFAEEAFDFN